MTKLHPYLNFNGNCREAMTFYKECIGGELELLPLGESQMAASSPAEMHNQIMHSRLSLDGETLLFASDMMGEGVASAGNMMSLCIVCKSKEEIETFFAKLSQGGTVGHALKEEFFGTFGDFEDKYGLRWMLQYAPEQKA